MSDDLQSLFDDANGHLAVGEFDEAIVLYRECVAQDPEFFDGWHALGMALMKIGRYPEAVFLGTVQGEALAETYAAADVFVFPSKTDTFGLVLLEALASGVPVAALPVCGPLDVIGDAPVGVLDHDLHKACLKALTISRDSCREFALERSWDACAQAFIDNVTRERPPQVKRHWRRRLARRLRLSREQLPTEIAPSA